MIQGLLALTLLTACLAATFWILQRMILTLVDAIREDRARHSFPWQRELLELRFLQAQENRGHQQSQSWNDARWSRRICWARDRTTQRLVVLVGVTRPDEYDPTADLRLMAVFEYYGGTWHADGRYIDSPTPAAACEAARLDALDPADELDDRP